MKPFIEVISMAVTPRIFFEESGKIYNLYDDGRKNPLKELGKPDPNRPKRKRKKIIRAIHELLPRYAQIEGGKK